MRTLLTLSILIIFSIISPIVMADNTVNGSIINGSMINDNENHTDNITGVYIYPKISVRTTFIGKDRYWNGQIVLVNIVSNRLGHLVYIEEYYTVDSNSKPKYYTGKRYYDDNLTNYNLNFQILRPNKSPKTYALTKGIVILDNKRVYEKWITSNASDLIDVEDESVMANNFSIKTNKTNESNKSVNSTTKNIVTPIAGNPVEDIGNIKKSTDIGIIPIIFIIFLAYIWKSKNKGKK